MKKIISLSLITILVLFLTGCGEIVTSLEMKTRINPDGSATREMEFTTDESEESVEKHYILPEGDKWEIKGSIFIEPYRYQAKGTFSNVNDIPPDYQRKAEFSDKVSRNYIDFKKRNYFFFTIYEYNEIFKDIAVEKTFREVVNEVFEDFSKLFLDELKKRVGKDYDISKAEKIIQKKYRPLFNQLVEAVIKTGWNSSETAQAIEASDEELSDEEIAKTITSVLAKGKSKEEKARLEAEIKVACEAVDERLEKLSEDQYSERDINKRGEEALGVYGLPLFASYEFKSTVIMPGKIIKTNAEEIVGNTLRWDFEPDDFLFKDYVIYAKSRIIHRLNILFGALIAVLAGGMILFRQRLIQLIITIKTKFSRRG